jgi:hypothetical protein
MREDRRQRVGNRRPAADEKALGNEARGALIAIEFVGHESAKRLHRDVDGGIEHPQHPGRGPERGGIGHEPQSQRRKDGADEEIGPPPAQARPGPVAHRPDQGLHEQAGHRTGQPQERELLR